MERGTTCYANVGHMVGKKRVEMQRTVHITLSQFLPCVGGQKKSDILADVEVGPQRKVTTSVSGGKKT